MKKNNAGFILGLFSVAVCCMLLLPRLLSYGLFFDGLTYSSIARNLAEGYGSFWKTYYTDTLYKVFYEHPAFSFWLQSFFFRIFGQAFYIEAIYSGILCFILIYVLHLLWNRINDGHIKLSGSWLVILFFSSLPIVSWAYSNNMIENTFAIILLLSVFTIYSTLFTELSKFSFLKAFLSGVFIFLGFLTKGPGALFPIATPFIAFLFLKEVSLKKALFLTLFQGAGIIACVLIFVAPNSQAINFFHNYFNNQLKNSLSGQREVASSHFALLKKLFQELLAPAVLALLLWAWQRGKLVFNTRIVLFFLVVAFSASAPYLISPKQMGWYIIPSLPFYVIVLALLFGNQALKLEKYLTEKKTPRNVFLTISVVLLFVSVSVMFSEYKVVRKEKSFFNDIYSQKINFPERGYVSIYPKRLSSAWGLIADMQRYYKVSLSDSLVYNYCIALKENEKDSVLLKNNYSVKVSSGNNFIVLKKQNK